MSAPTLDTAAVLDTAATVLDLAVTGGGGEVEVLVEHAAQTLTRFANSAIHQNVADTATTVWLRVHRDGRTATASTTVLGGGGPADLVGRAMAMVRHAPRDPGWPGLTPATAGPPADAPPDPPAGPPADGRTHPHADPATSEAEPGELAAVVRAFVDAAGGLPTAGYCTAATRRWAYVNSTGHAVADISTTAAFDGIARGAPTTGAPADGLARLASSRLADLDGARLGAVASAKALAARDPVDLPPGRYEVVLEPTAVTDLLEVMALYGFSGKALAERCSFAEPGTAQFDRSVTLVDDPSADATAGQRFDADGCPTGRLDLVRDGVTLAVATTGAPRHDSGSPPTGGPRSPERGGVRSPPTWPCCRAGPRRAPPASPRPRPRAPQRTPRRRSRTRPWPRSWRGCAGVCW
jgi:predicted Zn-dependent protease